MEAGGLSSPEGEKYRNATRKPTTGIESSRAEARGTEEKIRIPYYFRKKRARLDDEI